MADGTVRLRDVAVLVVACALVFGPSLDGPWVYDDVPMVRDAALLQLPVGRSIAAAFHEPVRRDLVPATQVSLRLDRLLPLRPERAHHLVNVLLHATSGLLVYALFRWPHLEPERARRVAFWTALLFLVHPSRVEAVAWISGRRGLLECLFGLMAVAAARAERPWLGRLGSLAFLALALLSKPAAVAWPLLLMIERWFFGPPLTLRRLVAAHLPHLALAAAAGALLLGWATGPGGAALLEGPPGERVGSALAAAGWYARLLAFPPRPSVIYVEEPVAALSAAALAGAALVVLVALAARRGPGAFAALWFGASLAPVLAFAPVRALVQDRYLYVPALGPLLALFLLLPARPRLLAAAPAALALACALASSAWVGLWLDPVALWRNALRSSPDSWLAAHNLGNALAERGDLAEAEDWLRRAAARAPAPSLVAPELARLLLAQGRADEAVDLLAPLAPPRGPAPELLPVLATAALRARRLDVAARAWVAALDLLPTDPRVLHDYGLFALQYGDGAAALERIERVAAATWGEAPPLLLDVLTALALQERGRAAGEAYAARARAAGVALPPKLEAALGHPAQP